MLLLLSLTSALAGDPALTGTYRLAQSSEEVDKIHAEAVERTLSNLAWAIRPLARGPVRKSVTNCANLSLRLDGEKFEAVCPGEDPIDLSRPTNGVPIVNPEGDTYVVDLATDNGGVTVRYAGEKGGMEYRFQVADDGITVRKEMFSKQLSEPVSWTVSYERVPR